MSTEKWEAERASLKFVNFFCKQAKVSQESNDIYHLYCLVNGPRAVVWTPLKLNHLLSVIFSMEDQSCFIWHRKTDETLDLRQA